MAKPRARHWARNIPVINWIGCAIVAVFIALAILGDAVAPYDPHALLTAPDSPPTADYPFGVDHLGRDILSRVISGARYTILLALGATALSLSLGFLIGGVAGYFGGMVDIILSRCIEIFLTIPRLFLVILLAAFLGSNIWVTIFVIGGTMWPINARLTRAQALTLRERAFVKAAETAGLPRWRILLTHIAPNASGPLVANSSLQIAEAVLLEAGLSFLGLGDPSRISWGKMIQEGQAGFPDAWCAEIFPGLALALLLLSIHLLGDALRRRLAVADEAVEAPLEVAVAK